MKYKQLKWWGIEMLNSLFPYWLIVKCAVEK